MNAGWVAAAILFVGVIVLCFIILRDRSRFRKYQPATPPADPVVVDSPERKVPLPVSSFPPSKTYLKVPMPRISFCTTCRGRVQHLRETLPQNLADNADYDNAVFIVLGYGDRDGLDEFMRSPEIMKHIQSGRVVYYKNPDPEVFEMAKAKNMAHRCGMREGGEILVNLDADNFTTTGFASYISENFKTDHDFFMWSKMIKGVLPRGINGRIVVSSNAFLLAGGYDEQFKTWANDDRDFNMRLRRLGYAGKQIHPRYLDAVRHSDRMRFKEYPHAQVDNYEERIEWLASSDVTIANFGNIGCGVVYRNFSVKRIEITPLPTRIFGIGMHKTATTSLHHAMKILGFNSAHWTNAHWAKAIWTEMQVWGKSSTLEKHYHLCDLPIPMLFRELDQAYPGSKFILTTLDDETWVKAAEVHWSSRNRFRAMWDSDPFTHKVHQELYGQRTFDSEVFLARYRRHNEEVLEHFKDRPQDLLVMKMSEGAGWKELAEFIGKPVPTVAYPHANSDWDTKDIWMDGK